VKLYWKKQMLKNALNELLVSAKKGNDVSPEIRFLIERLDTGMFDN